MKYFALLALCLGTATGAQANSSSIVGSPVAEQFGYQIAQAYSCSPRRTCSQIRSCDEARWYLRNCSWGGRLDGDSDGIPCESICR